MYAIHPLPASHHEATVLPTSQPGTSSEQASGGFDRVPFDRDAAESRYAEHSRRQADERYWEKERYGVDRRTGA